MKQRILLILAAACLLAAALVLGDEPAYAADCSGQFTFELSRGGEPGSKCDGMPRWTSGETDAYSVSWSGSFPMQPGTYEIKHSASNGTSRILVRLPGQTEMVSTDRFTVTQAGTVEFRFEFEHASGAGAGSLSVWLEAETCGDQLFAAHYYNAGDSNPVWAACEAPPQIGPASGLPVPWIKRSSFWAEWQGKGIAFKSGSYRWVTQGDGVKLWVTPTGQAEGSPIIDGSADSAVVTRSAPFQAGSGGRETGDPDYRYDIHLSYDNRGGHGQVRLWPEVVECRGSRFRVQYYQGTGDERFPVAATCLGIRLNSTPVGSPPHPWVQAGDFTAIYQGAFSVNPGDYQLRAAGTGTVSLAVGESTVVERSPGGGTGAYRSPGGNQDVTLTYEGTYEGGPGTVTFDWDVIDCPLGEFRTRYYNLTPPQTRPEADVRPDYVSCESSIDGGGSSSPFPPLVSNSFYASMDGRLRFLGGTYSITFFANGYGVLEMDGENLVNQWKSPLYSGVLDPMEVTPGDHDVHIEYANLQLDALAKLTWKVKGCPAGHYLAEYFSGTTVGAGTSWSACEALPDYDWDGSYRAARWTRKDIAVDRGLYAFTALPGDVKLHLKGGEARLDSPEATPPQLDYTTWNWSVNEVILDGQANSAIRELKAEEPAERYTLTLTYENIGGPVGLTWRRLDAEGDSAGLRCPAGTYLAEYFPTHDQTGKPYAAACESRAAWGSGRPDNWVDTKQYSVRWTGRIYLPEGWYTVETDGGGDPFEVYLNGELLSEPGGDASIHDWYIRDGTYDLSATYMVTALNQADATLNWEWKGLEPKESLISDGQCPAFSLTVGGEPTCLRFPLLHSSTAGAWVDLDRPLTVEWSGDPGFSGNAYRYYDLTAGVPQITLQVEGATVLSPSSARYAEMIPGANSTITVRYTLTPGAYAPRLWWEEVASAPPEPPLLLGLRFGAADRLIATFDRPLEGALQPVAAADFHVSRLVGDLPTSDVKVDSAAINPANHSEVILALHESIGLGESLQVQYTPTYGGISGATPVPGGLAVNVARGKPAEHEGVTATAAAVSGLLNADAGMVTTEQALWQVDLQGLCHLSEIRLYNAKGATGTAPARVSLSLDGSTWEPVQSSDEFGGIDSGMPRVIPVPGTIARYVLVKLDSLTPLRLDEVEVYGVPAPAAAAGWTPRSTVTRYPDAHAQPQEARVYGDLIAIPFDRPLDTRSTPAPTDFTVSVTDADAAVSVIEAKVESTGAAGTLTLYLDTMINEGQAVTVTYTPSDAHPLRDVSGGAVTFSPLAAKLYVGEPPFNLALYRAASQSSTPRNLPDIERPASPAPPAARLGVDGDRSTVFSTDLQRYPWWQVDLGEVATLTEIRLYNRSVRPDRASNIRVQVSTDGLEWTAVTYPDPGGVFSELRIPVAAVQARYVRLSLNTRDAEVEPEPTYLHLGEVEVYGYPADELP